MIFGIFGPDEGFWIFVGFGNEALDDSHAKPVAGIPIRNQMLDLIHQGGGVWPK
jgi:hypothetical protein